jgi:folate-binding protein YgfZ
MFLNERGRIVDSTALIHNDDHILCVGSKFYESDLLKWLDKYIIMDDCHPTPASDSYLVLKLWGPDTGALFARIFSKNSPSHPGRAMTVSSGEYNIRSVYLPAAGTLNTVWLVCPTPAVETILNRAADAAGRDTPFLAGEEAVAAFRIEQGIPSVPNEIGRDANPHDLNLLHEVNFNKGCYIGQEVVERLEALGKASRGLYGIIYNKENVSPSHKMEVLTRDGASAGFVTSTAYSPRRSCFISLAVLKKNAAGNGTTVSIINAQGGHYTGTVTNLPMEQ